MTPEEHVSGRSVDTDESDRLAQTEQILGYQFTDAQYLQRALTHSSVAAGREASNERLEFLGDAVLGLVICSALFEKYPENGEGDLTKQKSVAVSRKACAEVCRRLGLDRLMTAGRGLRTPSQAVTAALLEAVIAAVYLDGGMAAARTFVLSAFAPYIESNLPEDKANYKSRLQELCQSNGSGTPTYVLLSSRGPDHAREFHVAALIGDRRFPSAWGRTKKLAQQAAARNALTDLEQATGDAAETSGEPAAGDRNDSNSDTSE